MGKKVMPDFLLDLDEKKEKVLELAKIYRKFKERIEIKIQKSGLSFIDYTKTQEKDVCDPLRYIFFDHKMISSGKQFFALINNFKENELGMQINLKAEALNNNVRSLAIYSDDLIVLVFKIIGIYKQFYKEVDLEFFSMIFSPYQSTVLNILKFNKEELLEIDSTNGIFEILKDMSNDDDLMEKIEIEIKKRYEEKLQLIESLKEAVSDLGEKYKSDKEIARAIGIGRTTYNDAIGGKSKPEVLIGIIEKVKKLKQDKVEKREEIPKQVVEMKIPKIKKEALRQQLLKYGGKKSERGINFVLTPDIYKLIDLEISETLIELIKKQFDTLRAMLNMCSQIKNENTRDEIRNELSPQVEEMHLAIEAFAFAYPGKLMDVLNIQRQTFEQLSKPKNREK